MKSLMLAAARLATLLIACAVVGLGAPAAATDGAAISGQVMAEGEPVAGVRVTLTWLVGHWQLGAQFLGLEPFEAPVAETETDPAGRFEIVAPTAGFWSLKFEAKKSTRLAPLERLLLDVVDDRELGRLELQPKEVLEVLVTGAEQRPVAARLSIFRTANARRGADLMSLGDRQRPADRPDHPRADRRRPGVERGSRQPHSHRADRRVSVAASRPSGSGYRHGDRLCQAMGHDRRRRRTGADPADASHRHPQRPGHRSGRRPLGAVEIEVRRDLGRPEASAKYSAWGAGSVSGRSAEDGSFRIGGLPARMAFLASAKRQGWAPAELEIDPLERFGHREGLHLVLEPGRRAVGTVVDQAEEPVGGATVTLSLRTEREVGSRGRGPVGPARQSTTETDAAGRFALADLAAGRYDLDVTARDQAPARVLGIEILAVTDSPDHDATDLGVIVLEPGATVAGRIVDRDAQPIAGAEVRLSNDPKLPVSRARRALARVPAAAISDGQGGFTIGGQRPGAPVTLVIDGPDHLPEAVGGLTAPTQAPLEITLRPPSRVTGRVVDPHGQGVPEAQLMLIPEGRGGSGGFGGENLRADSRDDGSFAIHRVPAGRITLLCFAPGLQDSRASGLEVPEGGELANLELAMKAGATVTGVVHDPEGEPVVGAYVQLQNYRGGRKRALSDGDGRYLLGGLVATTVSVAADHDDYPRVAREVELEAGNNDVDLVFGGGVAVSGQVHDALGQPVPGAWVRLVRAVRSRHSPATVAGEDGSFLFPGIARGDYFVDAGRRGFARFRLEPPLQVRESAVAGVEVVLVPGASVSGQLLGLSAAELARVKVVAYGRLGPQAGEVNPDQRYLIDHLSAGDWAVRAAVEPDGRSVVERVTIDEGQEQASLDLDFASGFVLRGTAIHGGAPLQGARVGARGLSVGYSSDTTTDTQGRFRLDSLEAGRYWIGLYDYATGLRHSEEIEIDGDQELLIELITDQVSGVAVNSFDHEPVEDARIVLEPLLDDQEIAARLLQPAGVSDSDGFFSLGDVAHGRYQLVATRAGYAELRRLLEVDGPADDLELELTPSEGVFFELALADAGRVDWATAVVLDGDRPVAHGTWASSENGRLRITGVPPGTYTMLIAAPGSATLTMTVTSPGDLGRIVLPRAGRVDVVVPELAGDGTVAMLRFTGADGRPYRSVIRARVEDEFRLWEGRARIPGLPAGTWTVVVEAADGRSWTASATVVVDQVTAVTLD